MACFCHCLFLIPVWRVIQGPHTLISSPVSVDVIGGNAEAASVCKGKHTVPPRPDLVGEAGSSWWQAELGAPLCPQPRLPASLALQAGLLAGPQVIDKQIMETNKACLLSPHGDVAACCWKHIYSRQQAVVGSCMCISEPREMNVWTAHCETEHALSDMAQFVKASSFELRLNIRALWVPYGTGTVWKRSQSKAQRIAALCGSQAGCTAHTQTARLLEN